MRRFFILLSFLMMLPVILLAKDYQTVVFTTDNAGTVTFDHKIHMAANRNNCVACHNSIYKIGAKRAPVTMARMEKGESCGACHNGKNKVFPLSDCARCHPSQDVPMEITDFGEVVFSHQFHLGMYSCGDCHNKIFKPSKDNPRVTMAQMETGRSCGRCHEGSTAFSVKGDCVKCHAVKDLKLPSDSIFSHAFHLQAYSCNDCHSKLFVAGPRAKRRTMKEMEKGNSCGACHDGSSAFSVKGDCNKCHPSTHDVKFAAGAATFSHSFHTQAYGCGDCHSGIFIGGVNSIRHNMKQMEQGKSCGSCHDGKSAFAVTGSCEKCHPATKEIIFNIKNSGTVAFSHSLHQGMYSCADCHNGVFGTGVAAKRFTMKEMEQGRSCGACHDGKTAFAVTSCGKCHPVKEIHFEYAAGFSHDKHLTMFTCTDCHDGLFAAGEGNKRRTMSDMEQGLSCGSCHDGNGGFSVKGDCGKCHARTADVVFRNAKTGVTTFSHKFHLQAFNCGDCHNGIFTAGAAAKRFTMKEMEQGKSCGACHDGKSGFSVKESCDRCHPVKEITFKESGAAFSHAFHLQAYQCGDCHNKLFKAGGDSKRFSMLDMEKGASCGACHDGNTAFRVTGDCQKCHPTTRAIRYADLPGAQDVVFSHKFHVNAGFGCTNCHGSVVPLSGSKSYSMKEMEQGKFCGACHGGMSMVFGVKDRETCSRCHKP